MLDFSTLFLSTVLVTAVSLIPIAVLLRLAPTDASVWRWWSGAVALTGALLLFALRPVLPVFLAIIGANCLYVGGHVAIMEGTLDRVGSPWRRRLLLPSVLGVGALLGLLLLMDAPTQHRVVLISGTQSGTSLITAWALLRARERSEPLTLMGSAFALIGLFAMARAAGTPLTQLDSSLMDHSHWLQTSLAWGHLGAYVAMVAGMCLLVAERLAVQVRDEREALILQSDRLRAVVDTTPGIVWEADARTLNMTFVSKQAEKLLGYSVEELLVPGFWPSNIHPEDAEQAIERCVTLTALGHDHELDYRFVAKDGRAIWLHDIVHVVKEDGQPRWLRGVFVDISERKTLERELRAAKEAAERADQAKSRFLAAMSHELRTPMNGVIALMDVVMDSELSPSQSEDLSVAVASASRLMDILNDILDVTRIEAGQVSSQPEALSPADLLSGVLSLFRAQLQAKGLRLEQRLELPAWIEVDGRHLAQVVTNLVSNAVKYTDAGAVTVCASLSEGASTLRVEVSDTGPGVPESLREEVFQPFERLDVDAGLHPRGVGLGLPISRQLAALMGGSLTLTEADSGGARFVLEVPARALPAPGHAAQRLAALGHAGLTALIVEDDEVNQFVFSKMFLALGVRPEVAGSGEGALAMLEEGLRPDLIFLDIRLPGMDGHEAARRVRSLLGPACPPLIALTANAFAEDRDKAKEAGMDDFLEKPLRLQALRGVVASLGQPPDASANA